MRLNDTKFISTLQHHNSIFLLALRLWIALYLIVDAYVRCIPFGSLSYHNAHFTIENALCANCKSHITETIHDTCSLSERGNQNVSSSFQFFYFILWPAASMLTHTLCTLHILFNPMHCCSEQKKT